MAVSIVNAASTAGASSPLSCAKPTNTADGDVMVAFQSNDFGTYAATTPPAGWTLLTGYDRGSNGFHVKIWTKVAAGEGGTYSFAQSASTDGCVTIVTLRGADTNTANWLTAALSNITAPATTYDAPTVSGAAAGSALLAFVMSENSNTATTFTWTPPGGMTEQADVQSTTWTSQSVASLLSPSNPTGAKTFTHTGAAGTTGGAITASIVIPAAGGATAYTGTASISVAASLTSAGVVGKASGAATTVTAGPVATASVGVASQASLPLTATAVGTGIVARFGDAALTVTAGRPSAGAVGSNGAASTNFTAATTASGVVAVSTGSALTVTIGSTGAGVVLSGLSGAAPLPVAVDRTAAGTVTTGAPPPFFSLLWTLIGVDDMPASEGFNTPPLSLPLYVSWHADLILNFQNVDPATADDPSPTPIDFPAGASVYLDVNTKPPLRTTAVLNGPDGVARVESDTADGFRDGTIWVLLISEPDNPTREVPIVNGVIVRADGKSQ